MEIHTVGAMLMHADRRTDGWTEVMKLMVDFAAMRMHLKKYGGSRQTVGDVT
jgi:hypothetical protein